MGNLRVGHEDVDTVLSILLVVSLRLKDELFEDAVIPCNDAGRKALFVRNKFDSDKRPQMEAHLTESSAQFPQAVVRLVRVICANCEFGETCTAEKETKRTYAEPVTAVIDCVCRAFKKRY